MRVLVLTPYPYGTTAGPRSSFELWERVLREADISLEYAVFETDRLHEIIYRARPRWAEGARDGARVREVRAQGPRPRPLRRRARQPRGDADRAGGDRALGGPERQAADLSARRSPVHPLPQPVERMALLPQGAGEGENAVRDQQGRAGELAESRGFRAQAQRKCLGDPERRRCRPLHGLDAGHRPRSTAPCAWAGAGARARPRTCK